MSADSPDPLVVDDPPSDDVAIGESPDGDRLEGDRARWLLLKRRDVLVGLGALGAIAAIAEGDLGGSSGSGGTLYGGTMALDKAYKIGPRTYMGPDSAKSNVLSSIDDSEGWLYEATDTNVEYYLDNDAWQLRSIGSSSKPVPAVTTEQVDITNETVVTARGNNGTSSGHSAQSWATCLYDLEITDNRDEYDPSTSRFTPDSTGEYRVVAYARISGHSDQDRIQLRLRDVTGGADAWLTPLVTIDGTSKIGAPIPLVAEAELTGGNAHEVQVRNFDSSFNVDHDASRTRLAIRSGFQ